MLTTALVAAALTLPAAGTLPPEALPTGGGSVSLALQNVSGRGLTGNLRFMLNNGAMEMAASLMAPPANVLGFFTADAYFAFIGQTGAFLPVNLMPVMGFGAASSFLDLPTGTGATASTKLDLNMWLYMPVGLRYVVKLGGLSVGAEALYHMPAVYLLKGQSDPSRWHYGLSARAGKLFGEAFYETGATYNGPGARAGLVF